MNAKSIADFDAELKQVFGAGTYTAPLVDDSRMGRRIFGVDLTQPLQPEQSRLMVDLLDRFSVISFPNQDQYKFRLAYLERIANHFGAPIPHPKNYANYAEYKNNNAPLELPPIDQQAHTKCGEAFPDKLQCIEDANSPAVYIVTNLLGSGPNAQEQAMGSLHWHTDIEFEPVPLSTSMFYVQAAPTTRNSPEGTWVSPRPREPGYYHAESSPELMQRRNELPLNGETAYADTAAAYADLSAEDKRLLDGLLVRRRLRVGDPGWLIPLVYTNPRTGVKSLHSPVWASRGKNIAPVEVDGLSADDSRLFLDRLEAHVLQSQYRYDHVHKPGDVTLWSNFATLHNAPACKSVINNPHDARLMYRISCKGEPCFSLPRQDPDEWLDKNITPPYKSPDTYFGD